MARNVARSPAVRGLVVVAVVLVIVALTVRTVVWPSRSSASTKAPTPRAPAAANAPTPPSQASTGGPARPRSLAAARASSRDLGPIPASTVLHLVLPLRPRDASRLQQVIASGQTVSPATYDAQFSPSPTLVQAAIDQLTAAGLQASWTPGSSMLRVTGPAGEASKLFGVSIHRYAPAHAAPFQAPAGSPRLNGALGRVVTSVLGMDDYQRVVRAAPAAGPASAGAYTPAQVLGAYGFDALTKAGLTGKGETIVFIEIDKFQTVDLETFRQAFNEPPLTVQVAPNHNWGNPAPTAGEADMDLEIAHAASPDAKLVVYYSDSKPADVAGAFADAVRDHPDAIFSISLGACEAGSDVQSAAGAWNTSMQRLAGTGGNVFVASGDQGAFPCGPDDNGNLVPTISSPADDPYATAVGGTTLFIGQGNTYSREAGWGLPIEQVGSGGGLSMVWKLPSYQAGPGVNNPQSTGMRQVPDVASLGDGLTGWDICTKHGTSSCWVPAAGTSSGAPLWAALTSLINESAVSHNVKRVGFPNPALYAFAQHPERYPAPAFHDVTQGNNLYYESTPAWDFVTGLGTPNAGALLDDFLAYQAGH